MKKENSREKSSDLYNNIRVIVWIICVGVPLRAWYVAAGGTGLTKAIVFSITAIAILVILECLVFKKWAGKLDTKAAITQGNMYSRTADGYRSAFDEPDENQKIIEESRKKK